MSPIRILHIVGRMNYGGAENRLLELARCIDPSRFHFDFCVFQEDPGVQAKELKSLGWGIKTCRLTRNVPGFARRFRTLLRQNTYDVVHAHVHWFSGLPLRLAAKQEVPKRIMHVRTAKLCPPDNLYRICYSKLMTHWVRKYSTNIVAVSRSSMEAFWGPDWKIDPRNEVIYNGLELKPFLNDYNHRQTRAEFGISPQEKLVIHVGNFSLPKNHEIIIRTAALLRERRRGVRFILVGDGPLLQPIKKLVQELELEPWVLCLGRRGDVPRLLLASDCFIFPSRWEGLPGAVLEALAAGLTVVASNIGPNQEVANVSDRVIIVPQNDEQAYAREVTKVLDDPEKYKVKPGQLPDTFRMDAFVDKILKLYED
jgi:glycosyltransferase involved in cell wall biosynthesis